MIWSDNQLVTLTVMAYAVGGVFMYKVATKCGDDCSEEDKGALKARL